MKSTTENVIKLFRYQIEKEEKDGKLEVNDNGTLLLTLNGENRKRRIGKIEIEDERLIVFRKWEKETGKQNNIKAWSIPNCIAWEVDKMIYETDFATYTLSKEQFRQFYQFMPWGSQGIDRKVYVPIRFWDIKAKHIFDQIMINTIGYDWYDELYDDFRDRRIIMDIKNQSNVMNALRALKYCSYFGTRIIILCEDYAHLHEMYPEITSVVYGVTDHTPLNIDDWAKQGVLVLEKQSNAILQYLNERILDAAFNRRSQLILMSTPKTFSCFEHKYRKGDIRLPLEPESFIRANNGIQKIWGGEPTKW